MKESGISMSNIYWHQSFNQLKRQPAKYQQWQRNNGNGVMAISAIGSVISEK